MTMTGGAGGRGTGEILGYFKNGELRVLGAEPPTARVLPRGQGPQAPAGIKGAEPLCFVIAVKRRV